MTSVLKVAPEDGRFLAVAAAAWCGASVGPAIPIVVVTLGVGAMAMGIGRRRSLPVVVAAALLGGLVSGMSAAHRDEATTAAVLPTGDVLLLATVASDPVSGRHGLRVTIRPEYLESDAGWVPWRGPRLVVDGVPEGLMAGQRIGIAGTIRPGAFRVLQGPVAGTVVADTVVVIAEPRNPVVGLANRLRGRVLRSLSPVADRPQGALLSGFLIGDVRALPDRDYEALRLAGLSHFVVVSGSNVALFLAAVWVASGPLGWSPRRRIVVGLAGIVLFAVVTRWEPSVLRASAMAGGILVGRLAGWHLTAIRALALAVTALVLVSGGIVNDVGFQLSVAATAGIIVGAPAWIGRRPLWLWATLGATTSAQLAVAPLLILHFGSVPLMAPLTNLVSAPLVATATAIGGIGAVVGIGPVVEAAAAIAWMVLTVARASADLAHVGWLGVVVLAGLGAAAWRRPSLRAPIALVGVLVVAVTLAPTGAPAVPTAVFLDVGQGDATLFLGPDGETILVDGGSDPARLRGHLRQHGVRRIDLLIVTHRHADHAGGLVGITSTARVLNLWHPAQRGEGGAFDAVIDEVAGTGARVVEVAAGTTARLGSFEVTVLGPLRRYASPNDGSIVATVEAGGVVVLMTGDIEVIAQDELGPMPSHVLKVPHQGAATSSSAWLTSSQADIAVISVGPNSFGHPSQDVIDLLESLGTEVRRTDREGTIQIELVP